MIPLAAFEEIIDASGVTARIEAMLPAGVRSRQLRVRTLLAGMCLAQADHRPAHLTRVHQALTSLPEDEQRRLGVIAGWKAGPHRLTYRQTERTFGLVADALAKDAPDALPSDTLATICAALLEASIPDEFKHATPALAPDWTDVETPPRPPPPSPPPASPSATRPPPPATPPATPPPGPSRSAGPERSWSRTCTPPTAAPAAPTTAPSSPTATSTARPRPGR